MIRALKADQLFGVALDVLDPEPLARTHPVFEIDLIAGDSDAAFRRRAMESIPALQCEVAEAVTALLDGRWPAGTLNPQVVPKQPLRTPDH